MLKLAKAIPKLAALMRTLSISFRSLWPLMIVWLLFMFIFALLGLEFLGSKFRFLKTNGPRSNFDSFFPSQHGAGAFVTIFQIISTENWCVQERPWHAIVNGLCCIGRPLSGSDSAPRPTNNNQLITDLHR